MRRFRITVGGWTYVVDIDDPHASPVHVEVDGKPFEVYVDWESADDGAAVTPEVARTQPTVRGGAKGPLTRPQPASLVRPKADGAEDVRNLTAPMPGTILSVLVKEGDAVEPGQEICVLEAMKMKNSIRSPRKGTIAQVAVSAGATVAYGDLLVGFE